MDKTFTFTPRQRAAIAKELGTSRGIDALQDMVQRFRLQTSYGITDAKLRKHLRNMSKHAQVLRSSIEALARTGIRNTDWILEPLIACEECAEATLEYRFSGPLRRGRPRHTAAITMVQSAAALWEHVHGKSPGKGRGPFSRLVREMLRSSGVSRVPLRYTEELVAEALPIRLSVGVRGKTYRLSPPDERKSLPPVRRDAENFFDSVVWLANGMKSITFFTD